MNWKQHMIVAVIFSLLILLFVFNIQNQITLAILGLFSAFSALLPDLDHKMSKGTDLANKVVVILSFVFVISNVCTNSFSCFLDSVTLKLIFINSLVLIGIYFIVMTFLRPSHRGITHTVVASLAFSVLIYLVLGFNFAVAGIIGYGSHLLADKEIKLL
ncbi:MAG: metal-dependent hydrolase [Candidatus Micrarchaeota archaeon]|nr:metal-dependent hydrolase [Candidatus Micrarchaeota archaeon]